MGLRIIRGFQRGEEGTQGRENGGRKNLCATISRIFRLILQSTAILADTFSRLLGAFLTLLQGLSMKWTTEYALFSPDGRSFVF